MTKNNQDSLNRAKALMLTGRFTEALNLLQAEKSSISIDQETQFKFDLLINTLYIRQGDYKKAREEIDKVLKIERKILQELEKHGLAKNAEEINP